MRDTAGTDTTATTTTRGPMADPLAAVPPDSGPRELVVLGATGSIGTQAVDVVTRNPDRFRVVALAAGTGNLALLARQALDLGVSQVGTSRAEAGPALAEELRRYADGRPLPRIVAGPDAATELAGAECHTVLNAVTGSVGLAPTLAALEAGRTLALANKESLVAGGPLVERLARRGQVVPVDSEHSALFQCLAGNSRAEVRRLVLTASGGPFRGRDRASLDRVTPAEALAHPTWSMGPLVTVNSATMVNKGLEVIEAGLLFGIGLDRIDVVVHPQSVVHSMVEYTDGSTLAQVSPPDMRVPIALGLGWPGRVEDAAPACDWSTAGTWQFFPLDGEAFPAVDLARRAGRAGGVAPAVFNAANEECVRLFLDGAVPFTGIVDTVAKVLDDVAAAAPSTPLALADIQTAERRARERVRSLAA
ncbi:MULTISPECIES: 1-deoxy-D-xylulose-5-phosphate reductoisomerase [unclassified Streptomyces]|uniref:1-deoxy-D-xylulose-5-phosphate reductoisomerase n=1 Tax=unclassified Streptomyces TaxID=2593676 RepID=UPI0038704B24